MVKRGTNYIEGVLVKFLSRSSPAFCLTWHAERLERLIFWCPKITKYGSASSPYNKVIFPSPVIQTKERLFSKSSLELIRAVVIFFFFDNLSAEKKRGSEFESRSYQYCRAY